MANKSNKMDYSGLTLIVGGLESESGSTLAQIVAQAGVDVTAYAAADISATYVEAEVQAIADALETLRDEVASIEAKLVTAGVFT